MIFLTPKKEYRAVTSKGLIVSIMKGFRQDEEVISMIISNTGKHTGQ